MSKTRAERTQALEEWADRVDPADLKIADTGALREIADLTEQRREVDAELTPPSTLLDGHIALGRR